MERFQKVLVKLMCFFAHLLWTLGISEERLSRAVKKFDLAFGIIEGDSMLPTYKSGSLVLVDLGSPSFTVGDVVMAKHPRADYYVIKRIIGISALDKYYLIGDNQNHSIDSRHYGLVSRKNIIGRIIA